ncbi:TetR/AcrR family transcriptional regulator [Streptomyces flavofungini]|uniref:TetR/AcrR family transcriptional regulator n=1 Tax=Streptomyces flavofungini TaxID=68200 RepID=UPI0025B06322|nr:TetR/AcrR family transcriptional regulator [Streptomyces flavofungini]WJV47851.1 TetR/AcrR family transcriptional regulator [Streptomyces flavofungini]
MAVKRRRGAGEEAGEMAADGGGGAGLPGGSGPGAEAGTSARAGAEPSADAETGLPASLETAWGLRERPSKGPRPGLSLDRIVRAGIGVAAAEGVGAVSMGRVAKELGVSTMSLYRYVSAKDELYVLMEDAAVGPPPPMPADVTGWRAGLEWWARAQREVFHRNLWLLRIPVSSPPASPHSLQWMERGLAALAGTGLDEGRKISVIMLIGGYVRNEATLMADLDAAMTARGLTPDEVMRRYERTVDALTAPDPGRYPALRHLLASGALGAPDESPDVEFEFGLGCLLDGVEVLVRSGGGGTCTA